MQRSENKKLRQTNRLPELMNAESDPYGTRTRVAGVKGRSPRPLDEGAVILANLFNFCERIH